MHPIDLNYLSHEYRKIDEMEQRVEKIKLEKLNYVKKLERRFKKRCTSQEAQRRLKDHLDKNPKGEEMKKLKAIEDRLHHVIKQLDQKKERIEAFQRDRA